jgi:hypothetical protein
MFVNLLFVVLAGMSINAANSGGVSSGAEAAQDIKAGVVQGYSRDEFESYRLND